MFLNYRDCFRGMKVVNGAIGHLRLPFVGLA